MDEKYIETYLQQLRAMGFDEPTVEAYRQQLLQSMNFGQQMSQFTENLGAFNQMFDGGNDSLFSEDDVEMDPESSLTTAQQWAVACGANLAHRNGQVLNVLPAGLGKQTCRELLSNWWDIDSRAELLATFKRLDETGHRYDFGLILHAYNLLDMSEAKRYFREDLAGKIDEQLAVERLRNMRDGAEFFIKEGLITSTKDVPDLMIWDYARLINLCRNGIDAEYITEDEALAFIMDAAHKIQKAYNSWKDMSTAYLFARYVWSGDDEYDEWREEMDELLTNEKSPWVTLAWNTPLD